MRCLSAFKSLRSSQTETWIKMLERWAFILLYDWQGMMVSDKRICRREFGRNGRVSWWSELSAVHLAVLVRLAWRLSAPAVWVGLTLYRTLSYDSRALAADAACQCHQQQSRHSDLWVTWPIAAHQHLSVLPPLLSDQPIGFCLYERKYNIQMLTDTSVAAQSSMSVHSHTALGPRQVHCSRSFKAPWRTLATVARLNTHCLSLPIGWQWRNFFMSYASCFSAMLWVKPCKMFLTRTSLS